jgi:hypothetical protein
VAGDRLDRGDAAPSSRARLRVGSAAESGKRRSVAGDAFAAVVADPAAPSSETANADANRSLAPTAASGTELIEVCGVGWVAPDASGAADRAAVGADNDVLASQRALLDAVRRKDGDVGEAMATVLELQGAGRESAAGTPLQALMLCSAAPASSSIAACAGRDEDRQRAAALVERLAKRATATSEPRVYALAMQQCQWAKGAGSCALLNVDQWARVDDGNALPWLYILQRARDRNDPAQVEEALHHIGAAARFEVASYAIAGRVADVADASDVDVIAALLAAVDAVNIAASRIEPYAALNNVCKSASLADANRRQACERAAETLTDRSDSPMAVVAGAEIGRGIGWPAERVDALRRLAYSSSGDGRSQREAARPRRAAELVRQRSPHPRVVFEEGKGRRSAGGARVARVARRRCCGRRVGSVAVRAREPGRRHCVPTRPQRCPQADAASAAFAAVTAALPAVQPASSSVPRRRRRRLARALPRIPQPRRQTVDRDVDAALDAVERRIVLAARAVAPHQLDLQVIQRVEVRKAVLDRTRERGVVREAMALAGDARERGVRPLPLFSMRAKMRLPAFLSSASAA